ncbi:hypothetical protein ACFV0C_00205 [Streptomyces sp. NPDC059568]|uniref:hypothetical protein n=1 Tax=Streptomyces sp. NPDC059568 TaxID=3346868 RepID=UPI0036AAA489
MTQRTWFITGTSRGFGREWATAALDRGDRVVGTARDTSANDDLVVEYPKTFWGPAVRAAVAAVQAGVPAGDPTASAAAVLRIVDAENPPLRSLLGTVPLHVVEADYASRLDTWRTWQSVAELAPG